MPRQTWLPVNSVEMPGNEPGSEMVRFKHLQAYSIN